MLQYLIKFSISLSVLYIFYKLVLRPLTFYQWNRFYLLSYSLLSFLIPFININPWVDKQVAKDNTLINVIPTIGDYGAFTNNDIAGNITAPEISLSHQLNSTDWIIILFCLGCSIMLVRLLLQYVSLRRIRKSAILLNNNEGIRLYETRAPVGPFSFGNAIYINRSLHNDEELQRIIQHEFVHVKQKHTVDLMLGEFLCVVNWFNPFAWFIRQAIRQNLEFIADNNVIEQGMDKKEYQYLLLKVVGIPQYSIASNFNFLNLKKRIAMMNKMKSARLQLTKFLFVLPLMAVMLLAFRNQSVHSYTKSNPPVINDSTPPKGLEVTDFFVNNKARDTTPVSSRPVLPSTIEYNEKGYRISVADNEGEKIVLVKDKFNKIIKAMTLEEWNNDKEKNELLYGKLLTDFVMVPDYPLSATVPDKPLYATVPDKPLSAIVPDHPLYAIVPDLPPNVESIKIYSNTDKKAGRHTYRATVTLKDGTKEIYNLDDKNQKQQFIKKYGDLATPPVPAVPAIDPISADPQKVEVSEFAKPVPQVPPGKLRTDHNKSEFTKPVPQVPPVKLKTDYNKNDSTHPLVIIDGVIKEIASDLNSLHSNELASVIVLKDNMATIKYGKIAKNGAIEITTKGNGLKQITFRKDTIPWKTSGEHRFKKPGYLINGKPATNKQVSDIKNRDIEKTELSNDYGKAGNSYDGTINLITSGVKDKKEASMFR